MSRSTHVDKRDTMLKFLDRGLVMVHLDPRYEGVEVPEWLKTDATLRLNIAYGFNLPALEVDAEGIYAVLSFGCQNYGCTLPWASIFALTLPDEAHDGQVWPESLPAELFDAMAKAQEAEVEASSPGPHLRIVDEPEAVITPELSEPEESAGEGDSLAETPPHAPAKLRLVTD